MNPNCTSHDNGLAAIISESSPESLEAEVTKNLEFLESLTPLFEELAVEDSSSQHWMQQIKTLKNKAVKISTVIGVVGNTGAGKSSIVNALLDEERLVPMNCMRACTSVVTEISWNANNDKNARYRAEVEFIQAEDWQKELTILFAELHDGNGNISRHSTNMDTEAAYAKIKAVYPERTRDDLAGSKVEELMQDPCVQDVLGTITTIEEALPEPFYKKLKGYIDSTEKFSDASKRKRETKRIELWPLIKVVKIQTMAAALSTGAVIVDLPGGHDSNAARAAVAENYLKTCTSLWIVAPINRAVDDKVAKSLLGDAFKRQLKYDGAHARVTFICTKTDDISITEASDSLDLEGEISQYWDRIDQVDRHISTLHESVEELEDMKTEFENDQRDIWAQLHNDNLEKGETALVSSVILRKRKHSAMDPYEDSIYSTVSITPDEESAVKLSIAHTECSSRNSSVTLFGMEDDGATWDSTSHVTSEERADVDAKIDSLKQELEVLRMSKADLEAKIRALCISSRNQYAKSAIRQDYAAGVKETDHESAIEEDESSFDPEDDFRDYDDVARSLPVFCVSSRSYQKLSGRLSREPDLPGFQTLEETEIPQLQVHCKKLTEAGRISSCRRFLNSLDQMLTSLNLWICNDDGRQGTSAVDETIQAVLQLRLQGLKNGFRDAIQECSQEIEQTLAENIFNICEQVSQAAVNEAPSTVAKWGAPVKRENRSTGGYAWATYKAICRRHGVLKNAHGAHDMNMQLAEPIMKKLANPWEKTFSMKLPHALERFSQSSNALLISFHEEIERRAASKDTPPGFWFLGQQLRKYEATFGDAVHSITSTINTRQLEANRAFLPVIARHLAPAYNSCAAETGVGQYARMKMHMTIHVENCCSVMLSESCKAVESLLKEMCHDVEALLLTQAQTVFQTVRRDYITVLDNKRLSDKPVSRLERKMKYEVAKLMQTRGHLTCNESSKDTAHRCQQLHHPQARQTSFRPEQMRDLPEVFTMEEKVMWEHRLTMLYKQMEAHPENTKQHQDARKWLEDFSAHFPRMISYRVARTQI